MKFALAQLNFHIGNFSSNQEKIIENIKQGQKIKPGSYKGRKSSEPENQRSTLTDN